VNRTEKDIVEKCEEMKTQIEEHKSKLLGKLDEAKERHMKQAEKVRKEVQCHRQMLDHFKRYITELIRKWKACDVAKEAGSLRARAKELMQFDVYEDLKAERSSTDVKFKSEVQRNNVEQVFGELTVDVATEGKK
jgi:hypothetical protein